MKDDQYPSTGCWILNLDDRSGPGTHWTVVYNDEYYDSFGLPPPERLASRISWYNHKQHQRDRPICGYYCIYYIRQRNRGLTRYDICYDRL